MTYYKQSGSDKPESFITKGKQRLKQYLDTVYLNNGDEFEIELFNPTTHKFLAKIELNGNSIGSGIVLRPGERVFLERYLDKAKKFLFEVYQVEDTSELREITKNNGDVVIKFFKEKQGYSSTWGITTTDLITTTGTTFTTNWGVTYTPNIIGATTSLYSNNIETGRVEKGSSSTQNLVFDNSSFESLTLHGQWWKIRPMSEKSFTKEDLTVYCTECGAKRKKDTFKFCPHCGNKF